MRSALIIAGMIILLISNYSHAESWGTIWDRFLDEPRAEIIPGTSSEGTERRYIRLKSGIVIDQIRKGTDVSSHPWDTSGLGAVMCTWETYVEVKAGLSACQTEKYADVLKDLDQALDMINDFVVANSLSPVAKSQLEADIEERTKHALESQPSNSACPHQELVILFADRLIAMPADEFWKSVEKMLSVPRPPVMNPCL